MKGPDRDRLIKLFRMLGSDNAGERGNTWAIIDEILRKHRMSWNDLVELVQTAPAEPSHSADETTLLPPAKRLAPTYALDLVHYIFQEYVEVGNARVRGDRALVPSHVTSTTSSW